MYLKIYAKHSDAARKEFRTETHAREYMKARQPSVQGSFNFGVIKTI